MFSDHIFLCDNETFLNEYSVCTYLDIKRNFLQSFTGIFSEFFSTYYIQLNNLKINNKRQTDYVNFKRTLLYPQFFQKKKEKNWLNPIPTGHGRNQPIYERHVTKSGRNRVKIKGLEFSNRTWGPHFQGSSHPEEQKYGIPKKQNQACFTVKLITFEHKENLLNVWFHNFQFQIKRYSLNPYIGSN